ncbi:serine/threonine phosphatase PrpC [Labilithrix luteola]|uniref:Serine/threonine phosphatase PrpC n=1 Tax=Labilithrix luteola TaxID=1391654 RepID=A0A0K1QDK9_9BACT|nr:protein phosphatase 2C domain-containing protein [Labilithrix luteola]AKV03861.1 serine/threonine phosphatase PrpC [Labilithrix luteola]
MTERANVPAVEIAFRTDPGRDPEKQVNEDSARHVETALGLLAVVCDGMGGHAGGKEASELAVKTIVELVQSAPPMTKPRDALRVAIEEANRRVWSMPTNESGHRPGSTVVAALVHPGGADIAHVGDSRIYLVHAGAIAQVTKDHSMVQQMVEHNIIRAEDAASHPDANKILRALGIAKDVEVELRPEPIPYVAGDVLVLCSDGLSDLVGPAEILDTAGGKPAQQAAGQLVDLANARGGHDNITAMVLRMKASAAVSESATLVKTVQLTAHAVPPDRASGPRGTQMAPAHAAMPAGGTHMMPAATPVGGNPPVSAVVGIPPAPNRPSEAGAGRSRAPLAIGIGLALIALAIAGVLVWTLNQPKHVNVPIVANDAGMRDAAASTDSNEDASVTTDVTPVPPLTSPSGSAAKWWLDPDASPPNGEPRECARARWAKKAGKPANLVETYEKACRAAGGSL